MMKEEVRYGGRTFVPSIPKDEIHEAVIRLADQLNRDYAGKDPIFLVMLNGAFMFASDLVKEVEFDCVVSFIKVSSYAGTASTGQVTELIGLDVDVRDRDVIIVEDIVESGLTMHQAVDQLRRAGAKTVEICSFVHKPMKLIYHDVKPKYIGLNIKDSFIIGYGLDIDGYARNLPEVYELAEEK
jgi:hypoxanthine phosphoribosyltransferase